MQHTQRTACLLSKIYAVKTGQPQFDDAKLQNCGKAFVKSKEWATFALPSPDGGTGRRARLKIWLSQGSAGSIPVLGTNPTIPCRVFYLLHRSLGYQKKRNWWIPVPRFSSVLTLLQMYVLLNSRRYRSITPLTDLDKINTTGQADTMLFII